MLIAEDGNQAIEILKREKVDMLFTDVIMPGGINGITVANFAKELPNAPKILVTTGWSSQNDDEEESRAGYVVLNKPYLPNALVRKIREILDGPNGVA